MKIALSVSVILNLFLLYFIGKRFYYNKIPPVLWSYDIAMLGDSHVERGQWNKLLDCSVANFGKGKSTVKQMYLRLPGVVNCNPVSCFIHGGINDIVNNVPYDTTIFYFRAILAGLKQSGIRPVIIEVMPIADSAINEKVTALNSKLRFLAPTIQTGITPDDLGPDGIHMEGPGYVKWAGAIQHYLNRK